MRFSEAIPKFTAWKQYGAKQSTASSYGMYLRQFALFMRNPNIEDVSYEDVVTYLDTMTELGWDKNSYLGKSIAIRKFFEFFKKLGMKVLDYELVPIPDRDYHFPKITDDDDIKLLLEAIPGGRHKEHMRYTRNRAIIFMLWNTGMRVGELTSLNIDDVDTVKMKAVIKTAKSKGIKPIRQIMWAKDCNNALKEWLKDRKRAQTILRDCELEPLFVNIAASHSGSRMDKKGVEEMLRRLSRKANLGYNCNPHRFRHAFGRDLAKKGANNSVISSLMGHASLQSSYVYTAMDDKMMDEQYTKFRR